MADTPDDAVLRSVGVVRPYRGESRPAATWRAPTAEGRPRAGLGWVPALAAATAFGLLVMSIGDALSRATISSGQLPFWGGLLFIFAPTVFRLTGGEAGRNERIALVLLLGASLYLVKVFFAPFGFLFADELAHEPNANAILQTHHLFHSTSILPVTASYPGLESAAAALASLSGLTIFGSGLILIGVARVAMMLALYLLFERLSGSSRVGGLAAIVYTANANFLFFDAQFSYESLALPLFVVVLAAVAEWRLAVDRRPWSIVIVLVTAAVVVTHHLTSYALAGFLVALCIAYAILASSRFADAPVRLAAFAVAAALAWVAAVARSTVQYLWPVVTKAFSSTIHTIQGQSAARQLFAGNGYQPPVIERVVGIVSILLLFGGAITGLIVLVRRHRHDPYAVVLGLGAAAFFTTLVARYVPAAWESANRASEYLFVGLAFVVAITGFEAWFPRRSRAFAGIVVTALLSIVFAGGVIAGWDPQLRLAHPYRIEADGRPVEAEGRQMARFVDANFPGSRAAASDADARLLATYAGTWALAGKSPDVYDVLRSTDYPPWEDDILGEHDLTLVVVDRRDRSFDNTWGYYFGVREPFGRPDTLRPKSVVRKFDRAGLAKPYDSGNIAVFIHP